MADRASIEHFFKRAKVHVPSCNECRCYANSRCLFHPCLFHRDSSMMTFHLYQLERLMAQQSGLRCTQSQSFVLCLDLSHSASIFLALSQSIFRALSQSVVLALSQSVFRARALSQSFFLALFQSVFRARALSQYFSLCLNHSFTLCLDQPFVHVLCLNISRSVSIILSRNLAAASVNLLLWNRLILFI